MILLEGLQCHDFLAEPGLLNLEGGALFVQLPQTLMCRSEDGGADVRCDLAPVIGSGATARRWWRRWRLGDENVVSIPAMAMS